MNDTVTVIHALTNTIGRKLSTFQSGREFPKHTSSCLNVGEVETRGPSLVFGFAHRDLRNPGAMLLMHLASDIIIKSSPKKETNQSPRDRQ